MDKQNDTVSILVLRQGHSPVEAGHLEQNGLKCSEEVGGRILDGRSTTVRSGQVADRAVQPSTLAMARKENMVNPFGSPEKWKTVASGQLMQRVTWNRMVTSPKSIP